ncbi:MAG: anthranilate phosphoribosyltransferase [Pseudomonadales bacterium]
MNIQQGIGSLIKGNSLSESDMQGVMRQIMTGEASDAQIGAFLTGLAAKGEVEAEIIGAAKVMRELADHVQVDHTELTDIVGTGGDGAKIFNVSTASSFVLAAAGAKVAKHGNRSVTSSSGAADLLEAAGVRLDLSSAEVGRCINEVGIGFMFAVNHHSAMRYAIGPRKELGVRTIFNLLGPLTNPALATHGLVGVFDNKYLPSYAAAFKAMGAAHMLCVTADDGLDELSIAASSQVFELNKGVISNYTINPEDYGLTRGKLTDLTVDSADQSLAMIKAAYKGSNQSAADMVALNSGAAIYAADLCSTIEQGIAMAQDAMLSGLALQKMKELAEFTQLLKENQ